MREDTTRYAARKVRTAVRVLLSDFLFFGSLVLPLPLVADPEVEDIATDGENLYFNPRWVDRSDPDQIRALTAGPAFSCALKHHVRRGDREYGQWQDACFLARLPFLKQAGLEPDMPGRLTMALAISPAEEKTAEQWYDVLEDMPKSDKPSQQGGQGQGQGQGASGGQRGRQQSQKSPKGQSGGQGQQQGQQGGQGSDSGQNGQPQASQGGNGYQGGTGEVKDAPAETQGERDQEERKWDKRAHQAVSLDKQAGDATVEFARMLGEAHQARQPWREILRQYMTDAARADYSWSRPNRRLIADGLYLPDLAGERMGRVVVGIDVSGSIDQRELDTFWGELRGIADELNPDYVTVIHCSNRIHAIEEFDGCDLPLEMEAKGGGGTAFKPVFDAVDKLPETPACLIYMTDQICYKSEYPEDVPPYPVLWASTLEADGRGQLQEPYFYPYGEEPFGEVLPLEFSEGE